MFEVSRSLHPEPEPDPDFFCSNIQQHSGSKLTSFSFKFFFRLIILEEFACVLWLDTSVRTIFVGRHI